MTSQPHPNPATRVCSKKALSRKEGAKKTGNRYVGEFFIASGQSKWQIIIVQMSWGLTSEMIAYAKTI